MLGFVLLTIETSKSLHYSLRVLEHCRERFFIYAHAQEMLFPVLRRAAGTIQKPGVLPGIRRRWKEVTL
jgi:hypothetical protein